MAAFAIVPGVPARRRGDPAGLPPVGGGFVGRERELDRIGALLMGPARLVTLIGPGGIGKTRLGEEAGRRLHRARRTPVFVVRLASLPKESGAAAVKEAITAAVLVDGFVGASAWDGAVQTLSPVDAAGRVVPAMLIVDNCEHVLAGAGAVIADLLDAVPGLTILATSREPVGYIDEQLEAVPPLSGSQSLELFRQRAELAGHPITEPGRVALAEQVARDVVGQDTYAEVEKLGSRLFLERDELEQIALGTWSVSTSPPTANDTSSWQALSAAEQEVAVLAAAGWPNSAIGVRRGTSTRTTDVQVSSIFQKLMIGSRDDIIRFVPPNQRNRVSAERSRIPRQSRDKPRSIRPRRQD